jgi:hypothetical protein
MAQITVDSYPGRTFSGQIEEILPQVDMATRTVRVRLAMANPGLKLKPGMFVNVDLKTNLGRQLVVPASAVFQSGTRQLVFLNHGNGSLEPKEIAIGPRVGDDFVVLKGLKAHESIVTSASFLLDSESQLQAAAGSFVPPPPGARGQRSNSECTRCCTGEHRLHHRSQSAAKGQQRLSSETHKCRWKAHYMELMFQSRSIWQRCRRWEWPQ